MSYAITYSLRTGGIRRVAMKNGKFLVFKSKVGAKKVAKEYEDMNPRVVKMRRRK